MIRKKVTATGCIKKKSNRTKNRKVTGQEGHNAMLEVLELLLRHQLTCSTTMAGRRKHQAAMKKIVAFVREKAQSGKNGKR